MKQNHKVIDSYNEYSINHTNIIIDKLTVYNC